MRLSHSYKEELSNFEQLQEQNAKLLELMEAKLEKKTEQLALNTEQMKFMQDKDI